MTYIVIGGTPCTKWSVAQKNDRETLPSGEGWEHFVNYKTVIERIKKKAKQEGANFYFLYENNKSAAQPIKDAIKKNLGVCDGTANYIEINSKLVSAQNRQRFYVHNLGDVQQPVDRGILLKDILQTGIVDRDKTYCLKHQAGNTRDYFKKHHTQVAFEPVCVAERGRIEDGVWKQRFEPRLDGKTNVITTVFKDNQICEPVRVGDYPTRLGNIDNIQGYRIYSYEGKSSTLCSNSGGAGAYTGLYAIPVEFSNGIPTRAVCCIDGKEYPVYEVKNGIISIKIKSEFREYAIKLPDGFYIIRKLTVTECCRLQGMPDQWFDDADGNKIMCETQCYKALGNGWQRDTVQHILSNIPVDKDEPIICVSMYDGISTGRFILEELGYTNITYIAYEIDKYCVKLSSHRYPDIIHKGDAFQVRDPSHNIISP